MNTKTIGIATTKRGFAAMWESGGGMTNTGHAQIITGREGEPRRPVYIRRSGSLACEDHALICVHEGFYIVNVGQHRGDCSVSISRIVKTTVKDIDGEKWEASAEVELVNHFSNGEWDKPLDAKFEAAVKAGKSKACSYHCRSAYYIDTSEKPAVSEADQKRRAEEIRRQDEDRAHLRQEKADREAQAKAKAEAESKAAKAAGLGARLEKASASLVALGREAVELGEVSFKSGWQQLLYTEGNVAGVEQRVRSLEAEQAEQERKRILRETFQPKFEAFKSRVEAIGLKIDYIDQGAWFAGCGHAYSEEGLAEFEARLSGEERKAAEAKAKADAEVRYQTLKAEGVAKGLPQNVEIWRRTGGRTNAGNGWVIGADGVEREPTSKHNPNPRRLSNYGEGFMVWEQILPGEVVLKWSKDCSAAEHKFEVVYLPSEGLTEAQLTHIAMVEEDLEREWDGACGLASGKPSPSVGNGWGLCKKSSMKSTGFATPFANL